MLPGDQTTSEHRLLVTAQSLLDAFFVNPIDGEIVYLTRTMQSITTLYRLEEPTGSFCQLFTIDWAPEDQRGGKPLVNALAGRNNLTYVLFALDWELPKIHQK